MDEVPAESLDRYQESPAVDDQLAVDRTIIALAEQDFDFALALRDVSEKRALDPLVLGELMSKRLDEQTIRRIYVRHFMSLVESVIATLKSEILTHAPNLSPAQQALLREK